MAAGGEIEFIAVPGTDDVALLAEAESRALLVGGDDFLDLVKDLALTHRTAGMRADVLVGQHLAAGAENADFEVFQGENPIVPIGNVGQFADHDFVRRHISPHSVCRYAMTFTRFPAGDETRSPRRTC